MTELKHYLSTYFYLPDTHLDQIAALFSVKTFQKGKFLVKKGGFVNGLSFIKEGIVRIYDKKDDREITQWLSTKGYFISDLGGLVFDRPARWSMVALTDCTCFSIDQKGYKKIGQIVPEWHQLEKQFLANCFMTIEERVFQFLSSSAAERYDHLFELNPSLFNEVSLQFIASMLGMSPETLSRIRAKKAKE